MKNASTWIGVVIIGAMAFGIWWFITPEGQSVKLPNVASAMSQMVKQPEPKTLKETFKVEPGKVREFYIEFREIPGRFYDSWSARGASAKISGANDDTLVRFKLLGPNNETLQDLDHPYTFVMDNGGILRMSERVVAIRREVPAGVKCDVTRYVDTRRHPVRGRRACVGC